MMQPLVERPLRAEGSVRDRLAACFSMATLKKWLPILGWLPRYNLTWLQMDLIAGATVGLTTVPQALAYAEVAGLPVQFGLYSAFMGGFIYCVFGTSKDITLGPTAIMSLLCSSYVRQDPVYAVLLTFLCGVIQASMAILRLGFLLDFISYPVIKGFTCAAAVTIGFSQIKNLLGLRDIPQQFFLQVYYTFRSLPQARVGDAVLGLFCLVLLVSLTVMKRTLGPGSDDLPVHVRAARGLVHGLATVRNALVVVTATCVAYSWELSGHHSFTITGETAQGLPPFQPPPFSETMANGTVIHFSEIAQDLGAGLAVIPLMGLLESIAIAKAFASQNDYRIDGNQELFAIGLTNIMGSFVSAYPVTGSFGRTAVNSQSGVCSPAGGVVTGVVVLLSLAFLMPLFCYIPKASLAAVIICAVAPMLDLCVVPRIWAVRRLDLLPFLVTFLLSFWQVQYGIVGGVLVSMVMLLYDIARPKLKVSDHDILVIELNSGLNFPATEYISKVLYTEALLGSSARSVVLDCGHMSSLDVTVVEELRDLLRQFELRGAGLVFCGLSHAMLEVLLAAELPGLKHTESVEAALQALSAEPDQTEALLSK
ncbi:sodium-independent sulfate anion transporter [Conger conger]|uniref:sodium-independent sulfate anion transporter n=1 Tax=Conger conger TaxID=82655 RepID=UPI002A5A7532|nr:sodium-independent sulfate anion transporter [Conger conger]